MKYFETSDGLTLAFRDRGEGVPLLCLPGLTRNGTDFDIVETEHGDRAHIIRLDLRGRGESDYDPDFRNYNIMVEARDVVELLDHLGLERAAILGTSRGGLIALVLAATVPDRLLGVLFNDIGPEVASAGLARIMTYLGVRPEARTLQEHALALEATMSAEFPGVTAAQWRAFAGRNLCQSAAGLELRYDPKLRDAMEAQAQEGGAAPDLWPFFDRLAGLPVALLRGANSDLLTAETAAEMLRRRPDLIHAEVPDRGHIPFLDEPQSREVIDRFLDALGA
jgi:pimeloyl-ACP methyl ester carboxylesterase